MENRSARQQMLLGVLGSRHNALCNQSSCTPTKGSRNSFIQDMTSLCQASVSIVTHVGTGRDLRIRSTRFLFYLYSTASTLSQARKGSEVPECAQIAFDRGIFKSLFVQPDLVFPPVLCISLRESRCARTLPWADSCSEALSAPVRERRSVRAAPTRLHRPPADSQTSSFSGAPKSPSHNSRTSASNAHASRPPDASACFGTPNPPFRPLLPVLLANSSHAAKWLLYLSVLMLTVCNEIISQIQGPHPNH